MCLVDAVRTEMMCTHEHGLNLLKGLATIVELSGMWTR